MLGSSERITGYPGVTGRKRKDIQIKGASRQVSSNAAIIPFATTQDFTMFYSRSTTFKNIVRDAS